MVNEHIETLILDDEFKDVATPHGYHYEYKVDEIKDHPKCWVLVRDNILLCSDFELEYVLKLSKFIHSGNTDGLIYLWSEITKFVDLYNNLFNIRPSFCYLQIVSELEVLRLKLRKELEERFMEV